MAIFIAVLPHFAPRLHTLWKRQKGKEKRKKKGGEEGGDIEGSLFGCELRFLASNLSDDNIHGEERTYPRREKKGKEKKGKKEKM